MKQMKRKVYHCGSHALYSAEVGARITKIEKLYDAEKIDAGQAKSRIAALQTSLRAEILLGAVPRNPKTGRLM